eukprot:CAMPEP_0170497474 /NCGR_PEP_ID=MMETSP0208-20121228/24865_1 /TAXON_ID=197538 /ORGANISM="Strombidium inclinatum, Strain S3" /LENGTH=193 /DNA_ID=CAMNT_0010774301 /DNA_START=2063 /DNA_END=2644 /DNA_ORIENTATION=+
MTLNELLLPLVSHPEEQEGIGNHVFLHFEIERGVCGEAGSMVNFDEPGLQLLINENIEAQDLEAHGVNVVLLGFALLVIIIDHVLGLVGNVQVVLQTRLHGTQGLYYQLLDLVHQLVAFLLTVIIVVLDIFKNRSEGPLMPRVHIFKILVEDELALVSTVYRIVRQVHEQVAEVLLRRGLVCVRREPSKALLE